MNEQWLLKKKSEIKYNGDKTFSPLFLEVLSKRYFNSQSEIDLYLNSNLKLLRDPSFLPNIDIAIERIMSAIDNNELIMIVGDYDVDGIMSTYVLYDSLKIAGANVDYTIPHRINDGYGINNAIIDKCNELGVSLIITCDNGIQAFEALEYASSFNIDVIITDHHEVKIEGNDLVIPKAVAAVNPKIDAASSQCNICGATVAFYVIVMLYDILYGDSSEVIDKYLAFISIATVCDVMELRGDNRIIVKEGLNAVSNSKNIGLQALIEACSLKKPISVYHLGFIIGPTLNASGRLDSAELALKCLLSSDYEEAKVYAEKLRELNEDRKQITLDGINLIEQKIEKNGLADGNYIVAYESSIHESIAGIIAGKIKEKYYKPCIILTNSNDLLKGSARSIEGVNIYSALSSVSHLLAKFGGHPMAAGLSLELSNLNEFRSMLNKIPYNKDVFIRKLMIDCIINFSDINDEVIEEMEYLQPYGNGNSKPLFSTLRVEVLSWELIGKNKNVLKLTFKNNNISLGGICFSNIEEVIKVLKENRYCDIVYTVSFNDFNNVRQKQLQLESIRVSK